MDEDGLIRSGPASHLDGCTSGREARHSSFGKML